MGTGRPHCHAKGRSLRVRGMVLGTGGNGKPPQMLMQAAFQQSAALQKGKAEAPSVAQHPREAEVLSPTERSTRKRCRKGFLGELVFRLGGFLHQQVPAQGEDLPLPCAPALSPSPWLQVNARAWRKSSKHQRCCLPAKEPEVRAEAACRLQQHSLGLLQHGAPSCERGKELEPLRSPKAVRCHMLHNEQPGGDDAAAAAEGLRGAASAGSAAARGVTGQRCECRPTPTKL
ncbi:uncharacterized protein LOC122168684, partial [Centrocercus urophasianus]|uniref:uncharacterized protein LOC122168684 n=1 Tax=Centrocercus urophasianus TaxID=9002 RepID=UPI001C64978D